jgi:GPH family glycoside/pentoside/hexuronide:cation symporter
MNTPKPEPFPLKAKPTDKLNFSTKLAFGAGDLGTAITANLQTFYFGLFLSSVAGVNAATAALILPIGKIWDAVNDPLVGFLSDRLPSRWGRRYPWMVIGSVPFGLIFVLMWIVPFESDWALFWYYTLVGILFNTAYTTINLPYTALTPELTQDYDERTSLNSFRFAFSIGGSLGSFVLAGFLFQQIADETRAYLVLSIICGIISILSVYWCVFGTADRVLKQKPQGTQASADQTPFLEQLKIAFSNRPFLYVIGIYLWSWVSGPNHRFHCSLFRHLLDGNAPSQIHPSLGCPNHCVSPIVFLELAQQKGR